MSSTFPTTIDTLTDGIADSYLNNPDHTTIHNDANDAIERIEAKVGEDASAVTTSHDYKLSGVTGSDKAASKTGEETFTDKTLTSPIIASLYQDAGKTKTVTMPAATDTLVGKATTDILTNKTLTKPVINGTNPTGATYTPATGAQVVALDCGTNNMHIVTGHAGGTAITFTVANVTNNQAFLVSILQGAVVSTITAWFATIRWADGITPTLTPVVGKRDTFGFIRTGANTYDGFIVGQGA